MERWQFIRWGIAASVLAHFLIVGGAVVSTSVRPYELPKSDEIEVNIVDEPQKTPEPVATPSPSPSPELALPQPAPSPSPAAAAPPPVPEPSQSPTREAKEPSKPPQPSPTPSSKAAKAAAKSEANKTEAKEAKSAAKPMPPPAPAPTPSYVPPEPDLTVKYGVMLGLPGPLAPLPQANGAQDENDSGPIATTNLAANLETALRQRVRSCARLPASLSLSDKVLVKLRFGMTRDGRLATEPEVREVIAASKAGPLKESAVEALNACQPYSMLPPERYREWQVIEMSFTPQDFSR
ncbi:conserved hypothetical protein [Bradyrhizobium oligotrophicum S58]|uniref:Uncharacterized protein n=1 Tax=Bradyrhizobium oligotrophicum S58 TaxID=1245469 RepID=M4Z6X7_9BRAD|nr:hypothetical protein [Bradyrhizobium oligotrophicum]BAM89169.1 conserved hypothetical protein [Bradyrhizobium oligotrophicum S58]